MRDNRNFLLFQAVVFALFLGCAEDHENAHQRATIAEEHAAFARAEDFLQLEAERPAYFYEDAVRCPATGSPCCAPTCLVAYDDGEACWLPTNEVVIALAPNLVCASQGYKLQVESCNAVAWQNGIEVDQWNQPCGNQE